MNAHLVTIYDKPPPSRTRLAWWRFVERQLPILVIYLLVATLIGVILAPFMSGDGSERLCWCPVETVRRRNCAQSESAEKRRDAHHSAVEPSIFV